MKKSTKILLGIATIWPLVYMIFFFTVVFSAILSAPRAGSFGRGGALPTLLTVIFPLHILTTILVMGLTIFYIVNVFRNDRVDKDKQVLWTIVLFMGNVIAMPIYWYLYIWGETKTPSSFTPTDRRILNDGGAPNWMNDATSREYERMYGRTPPPPPDWRE